MLSRSVMTVEQKHARQIGAEHDEARREDITRDEPVADFIQVHQQDDPAHHDDEDKGCQKQHVRMLLRHKVQKTR